MSFGTKITRIDLQTATMQRGGNGASMDDPGNNEEEIRRDPNGADGVPEKFEQRVLLALAVADPAGWTATQASKRLRSARIQVQVVGGDFGSPKHTVDCHPSGAEGDDLNWAYVTWATYAFREDWDGLEMGGTLGGFPTLATFNSTTKPGTNALRWSMNAKEATKSMVGSDYPVWVAKMSVETNAPTAAEDEGVVFYDENVIVTQSRPTLLVNLGNSTMPRRIHAHRRRLT
jgi:hypothetical protein